MHWTPALRAINFNDILKRPWVRRALVFAVLYPILHNPLLFTLNLGVESLFHVRVPALLNLILIGLKDAALIPVLLLASFLTGRWPFIVTCLGLLTTGLLFGPMGIKNLWIPTSTLVLLVLNRKHLQELVEALGSKAARVGMTFVIGSLLFGFVETSYRSTLDLNSGNWETYSPLVINNHYRCAKNRLNRSLTEKQMSRCDHTPLNFYKIEYVRDEEYLVHPTLFFPYGDSVIFSIVLFYSLIFCGVFVLSSATASGGISALAVPLIATGVFTTFSRIHSILSLLALAAVALGLLFTRAKQKHLFLYLLSFLIPIFWFYKDSSYLFSSFFEANTPSNMGHIQAMEGITKRAAAESFFSITEWVDQLAAGILLLSPILFLRQKPYRSWLFGYLAFVAVFVWAALKFDVQYGLFLRSSYDGPSESDFLRVLVGYGAPGVISHSLILGFIGSRLVKILKTAFTSSLRSINFWVGGLLSLMAAQLIVLQFVAPYVISGFVLFFTFLLIWFPLSERYLLQKGDSEAGES
jgi:hypothetical protein